MKTLLSLITIVYIKKVCITFGDHTSVDNTFVHNSFADNIVVDNTFVDNTFVSDQQVNILLSDDSIDLCNYSNDSQNSRSNICNYKACSYKL